MNAEGMEMCISAEHEKSPTVRVGLNVYKFENARFDTEPVKWKVFSARLNAEACK